MIDLNYKPKRKEEKEPGAGVIILTLMPMLIGMMILIECGLK